MVRKEYRWNEWNIEHIAEHNISVEEAEYVADRSPAQKVGDDKYLTRGKTADGTYIQVAFLIEDDDVVYVIHARPLTEAEKRRLTRRKRRK